MTRLQVFLLGCLVLSLLVPVAFTQRRGGPGGGPGGPGGFKMPTADESFDRMANGANSFDVNKVEFRSRWETPEQQREKMMTFLQTKGVTNGIMTRELYKEMFEKRMADMGKERAAKGFEALAKGADSFNVDTVEITGMMLFAGSAERQKEQMKKFLQSKGISTGMMTRDLYTEYSENRTKEFREKGDTRTEEEKKKDEEARNRDFFKSLDKDNDGALSKEELQAAREARLPGSGILDDFAKYDKNNNGKIEFE